MTTPMQIKQFNRRWELADNWCWNWIGPKTNGYGRISLGRERSEAAHRFSYRVVNGDIPEGMLVRHKCDNKACVNPLHLEVGTHADNSRDARERGITLTGSRWHAVKRKLPSGEKHHYAKLTAQDVIDIRNSNLSSYKIAKQYGMSDTHIRRIRNMGSWKCL